MRRDTGHGAGYGIPAEGKQPDCHERTPDAENDAALEYGTDFVFIPAKGAEKAADVIEKLYLDAAARLGTDQVQVLTPYRKKGEASVNALNERLWNLANPPAGGRREITAGGHVFRDGDKVIHIKNKNGISNGDTGRITGIYLNEDGVEVARLDFQTGGRWNTPVTSWIWWNTLMPQRCIKARGVNTRW